MGAGSSYSLRAPSIVASFLSLSAAAAASSASALHAMVYTWWVTRQPGALALLSAPAHLGHIAGAGGDAPAAMLAAPALTGLARASGNKEAPRAEMRSPEAFCGWMADDRPRARVPNQTARLFLFPFFGCPREVSGAKGDP